MSMPNLTTLHNAFRRALGRPVPLRIGALRWETRDLLTIELVEPGEASVCAGKVVVA